jgi:small-conductance mechanosensitive channel
VGLVLAIFVGIATAAALLGLIAVLRRYVRLLRLLAFPLIIGSAAIGVWVFLRLRPEHVVTLDSFFIWLVAFFLAAALLRVVGLYYFEIYLHAKRDMRLPPLLIGVSFLVAYLVVALLIFRVAFPDVSIAPLLATSAVTSLVLGLALQPILGNFFAGLVITVERPFRINDWIRVGEHEGRVVNITWRTTHLRTRDNDNLVIPNGKLADERVLNYYYPHPMHMERIKVGADYKVPPYRVRRALLEATAGVAGALDKPSPDVYVLSFDENAILYELRVWIEDVVQGPRIASDIRARIWEEFKKAGITVPHPIRTLELPPRPRRVASPENDAPRPAYLYVAEGPDRGASLALGGEAATVGRSRDCTLRLNEPNASKDHLRIAWQDGAWTLTDLGSSFGTQVNGQATKSRALAPLDRITVGGTVIIFESD